MKKLRLFALLPALLAALLMAGCDPGPDPSTVTKVDPMTSSAQAATGEAIQAATEGEVSLTRNFYFVIDGSGSMGDRPKVSEGDQQFTTKIEGAKWAVREFMKKVPADVNLGLYIFDHNGSREVLPIGADNREQFLKAVEDMYADGGTPLGESIEQGVESLVKQLRSQLGYGEFRLIVVTDGEVNAWTLNRGVGAAIKNGIPIYTIGFGLGEDHPLRQYSVTYQAADSAQDLEKALVEATSEMDQFDPSVFEGQ